MFWCKLFGHNYGITSVFGNYAFCTRCGTQIMIKDPQTILPRERRWMGTRLMEMTELGLEEVKDVEETDGEDWREQYRDIIGKDSGDHTVQSKDPHEQ